MSLSPTPCIRSCVRTVWLTAILWCMHLPAFSQESSRYFTGAVPVKEGKVTFSREIRVPERTQEHLFKLAEEWCYTRFLKTEETNPKILYLHEEAGEIACQGDEFLTFKKTVWVLDRSRITYQLILVCRPGVCEVSLSNIRYIYQIASSPVPEIHAAEKWITDEYALNKRKGTLLRSTGKFRIHTIDLAEELFNNLEAALSAP